MSEQETKKNVAIEYGLYIFRQLLEDGKITRKEFEKASRGFVSEMDTMKIAS